MKEFSKNEKYAMKFMNKEGFDFCVKKQYVSKTVFNVCRDGISYEFELQNGIENINQYMKMFLFSHGQRIELNQLRKLVG